MLRKKKVQMTETASAPVPVTDVEEYLKGIRFQEDDFEFQHMDEDLIDTNFASQSFWKDAYMRFKKNKGAVISFFCILLIILLAIVGPNMTPYTYATQDIKNQNLAPRVPGLEKLGILDGSETVKASGVAKKINKYISNKKTDVYYWFGSDSLGRDIWTRTWTGTRISLYIAVVAVLVDMLFGLSYGLISGYFGGKVDMVMQRIVEIVNSIPTPGGCYADDAGTQSRTYFDHGGAHRYRMDRNEQDCKSRDAEAEGTGICTCIKNTRSRQFPNYFQ